MAKKQSSKSKAKLSKNSINQKSQWIIATLLVLVVALAGLLILNYSRAGQYRTVAKSSVRSWCNSDDPNSMQPLVVTGVSFCVYTYRSLLENWFISYRGAKQGGNFTLTAVPEPIKYDGVLAEYYTKEFQRANGLPADGVVGPGTWRALMDWNAARGYLRD